MTRLIRNVLVCISLTAAFPALGSAVWQQPTPEELSMTSQPEVPGAPAVYLYREETTEDRESQNAGNNYHLIYVRLKVLTEAGKQYADVTIPYEALAFSIGNVEGRTIHSDGTVIPFTGQPFQKVVSKGKHSQVTETVFTLPDVQVGSIIEYRYQLKYSGYMVVAPQWYVQQDLFLRSGSFYFAASSQDISSGHSDLSYSSSVAYTQFLPPGVAVKYVSSQHAYQLTVHNIAPLASEEWTPPLGSVTYRVLFYYTAYQTAKEFWTTEGRYWSKDVDHFAGASSKMKEAVAQIVTPADTDQQKVHKIYDAVMAIENTTYTREHTQAENKAAGFKIKTADEIWEHKRGNSDEIALLFIALVRAAGINASAMGVTNRERSVFWESYLSMGQLDDLIAIVTIDGKDQFYDPGSRYCTFGQLHWTHTMSGGLRQLGGGATALAQTPGLGYEDAQTISVAQLELTADRQLKGVVKMKLTGPSALYWRQLALRTDEDAVKHELDESLQSSVPAGVQIKTNHFVGLADWKTDLSVILDVSGGMGTSSSKRIFLPSIFFEASTRPLFVHDQRRDPIDLRYPSLHQDTVNLTIPAGFSIETLPKDTRMSLPKNAIYVVKYASKPATYSAVRMFVLANSFYEVKDYPDLKDFYQKVSAQDQQQTILAAAPVAAGQ